MVPFDRAKLPGRDTACTGARPIVARVRATDSDDPCQTFPHSSVESSSIGSVLLLEDLTHLRTKQND